jgi:hypothetical protein
VYLCKNDGIMQSHTLSKNAIIVVIIPKMHFIVPSSQTPPWPESASELYRQSDRRLLAKLVPTFAVKKFGTHVHFLQVLVI